MEFLNLLVHIFSEYGYIAVFLVLILCGFGLPVPEDISLVSGGVIAGLGKADPHLMFLVGMAGVLLGDAAVFLVGRIYGVRVLRIPFFARIVTPERFSKVQDKISKYGNWVTFMARFMPGLRMPIYLTAGTSDRISFYRFVALDFLAAIISVPVWVYLGYFGAHNFDTLMTWVHQGQLTVLVLLGIAILFFAVFYFIRKKRSGA
ncbi:DedA family protein [Leptospira ellisii]|uniref:DedA family protein n=1 Tax=Leptospira ellisii TaxID=2023197 RepID=A0A2N0B6K6_9LEPT|nr:DedA family protein [Leptospira ellisii]MDV6237111.1 DedA family protein [Leptospira ellisii]PJZ92192.1 DedA family protein [Leptospira ellisii]PKA04892.1 DedA family protein [Leptospira ellisii]